MSVIYVIPFTSIIEQNAGVFRKALAALGPDIVLEHHSNLDPDSKHETTRNRLATENWNARVIVTTNVQFFESLHANRTSRCRKLHRIARSGVILDNLPRRLHDPGDLLNFRFKTTARDFQLIDDDTAPVLIPFGKKGRSLCAQLRKTYDPAEIRRLSRKLQRYAVNIPKEQHERLQTAGIVLPLHDQRFFLLHSNLHYSNQFGLHPEPDIDAPPSETIL